MLCQKPLGVPVTRTDVRLIRDYGARFVCFPEYFLVNRRLGNHGQTPHNQAGQLRRLETLSRALACAVIGGTMPELADGVLYNTSFVFDRGELLGWYRKRNLFFAEEGIITPGSEYRVFEAQGVTFGVLICADIFHDEAFHFMRAKGARIIFSPTFSPRKAEFSIYLMGTYFPEENERREALLARLGKHRMGKACLYVKRLKDIDTAVLRELTDISVRRLRETYPATGKA